MKRVVSVSLGSSRRNKTVEMSFGGEQFRIERIGTDGSVGKAEQLIAERDGKVEAIGLGGLDRYLIAGGRRYELRDAARMARNATRTPVVDGGGIKAILEPLVLRRVRGQREPEVQGFTFPSTRAWVESSTMELESAACGTPMVVVLSVGPVRPVIGTTGAPGHVQLLLDGEPLSLRFADDTLSVSTEASGP